MPTLGYTRTDWCLDERREHGSVGVGRHSDIRSSTYESRTEWYIDSDECSIFAISLDEVQFRLFLLVRDVELFEVGLQLYSIRLCECMLRPECDSILVFATFDFFDD